MLTLKMNFRRLFSDKTIWLLLVIPVGLIVINSMINDFIALDGYNVMASTSMATFMLSFQFFNMGIMLHFLYSDFRGDMRWRLKAAPHSLISFVLPAFTASWLFSIFLGVIIIAISTLFLSAYLGNVLIIATVLLITSLLASLIAMLIFLLVDKLGLANTLVYVISFGLMIISGFMFPLGDSAVTEFIFSYVSPLRLGTNAIIFSGALNDLNPANVGGGISQSLTNIGILAAMTATAAGLVALVSRRRKI